MATSHRYDQQGTPHRKSIRDKTSLASPSSSPWKLALKKKCLERAREKRKHTMLQRRKVAASSSFMRSGGNTFGEGMDMDTGMGGDVSSHTHPSASRSESMSSSKDAARQAVQEQLKATGVKIMSSSASSSSLIIQSPVLENNYNQNNIPSTPTGKQQQPQLYGSNINNGTILEQEQFIPSIAFHFSPMPSSSRSIYSPPTANDNVNGSASVDIGVGSDTLSLIPQFPPSSPFTPLNNHNLVHHKGMQHHISNVDATMGMKMHMNMDKRGVNNHNHYNHHNHSSDQQQLHHQHKENNWISEEDLFELMHEVEEELQLEHEAQLQVEINAMEEQEEIDSSYIHEQIESFQQQNTCVVPMLSSDPSSSSSLSSIHSQQQPPPSSIVPCPLCQVGNLIQDPNSKTIICQYYQNAHANTSSSISMERMQLRRCNLCLNGVKARGMSLDKLKDTLGQAYQEHASMGCRGMLRFELVRNSNRMEDNLVVGCDLCGKRATIV